VPQLRQAAGTLAASSGNAAADNIPKRSLVLSEKDVFLQKF